MLGFFRKKKKKGDDMSFLDHVEDLRWHLVRSAAVIMLFAAIAFMDDEIFGKDILFKMLLFGPIDKDFPTYTVLCNLSHQVGLGDALCFKDFNVPVTNFKMTGQFTLDMWAAFVAGLVIGFPYLLWELWRFVRPALKNNEMLAARGFLVSASLLFFSGVLFGYFIVTPLAVYFLVHYKASGAIANIFDVNSYIDVVTMLVLVMGLIFELPIIIFFLTRFGLVTADFLKRNRRYALIVILILAAVITPTTDVVTQMLVALPLWVLFEASIVVAKRVEKKMEAKQNA
ncbi:MAG: twin arginine targeting protein translocase subunit TatC [Bacteroidetes bacterium]|nr:MAG: twin arginine targeting protein translocase subunit TatC [Bacteroidota bacterium]